MIIKDEGNERKDYEPVRLGSHPARLFAIVDLGFNTDEFQGTTRSRRKILLGFEICDDKVEIDGEKKPKLMTNTMTYSVAEKSKLRGWLKSWKGYTDEQFREGIDLQKLIGEPCILSVTHTPRQDGGVWANIASVSDIISGMSVPPMETPPVIFNFPKAANIEKTMTQQEAAKVMDEIDTLPAMYKIQDKVKESDTYALYKDYTGVKVVKTEVVEDELPF